MFSTKPNSEFSESPSPKRMSAAMYKKTALKVLILWNLPTLLLIAGAFQAGTSTVVREKKMDITHSKPMSQHLDEFYGNPLTKVPYLQLLLKTSVG